MKTPHIIKAIAIASGSICASVLSTNADVTFLIKQVQAGAAGSDDGVSADVYVENIDLLKENKSQTGTHTALLPIGEYGSYFYFYVSGLPDQTEPVLLDTKFIGQYVATADVTVSTEDPYIPTRVRADELITIKVTTANAQWETAVANDSAPELLWDPMKLKLSADYEKIDETGNIIETGTFAAHPDAEADTGILELTANDEKEDIRLTGIPQDADVVGADPSRQPRNDAANRQRGKELITVEAVSDLDSNGDNVFRQVGSASVIVWPIAQGKVIGIIEDDVIVGTMPDLTIQLYDLYPKSYTYAEVIEGPPSLDPNRVVVHSPQRKPDYNGNEPKGSTGTPEEIAVVNWDDDIKENREYTLQVLTKTPFNGGNAERILAVPFTVKRSIKINASITSSE
jgi:hypothetical protein